MDQNELPVELANIRHLPTYAVTPGYFENLAEDIMGKVNLPLAANAPFSAPPVNYFDGLSNAILLKIKTAAATNDAQKELEEIEPLLTTVSKTNIYRVPDNYFTSFAVAIPALKKPASLLKMRSSTSWMSYAAAAMIAVVISSGVIFLAEKNKQDTDNAYSQALARVSDSELSDYLAQAPAVDADAISTSQDDDNATSGESIYKAFLNNVSDNELENYLNEN